jgi:hypothetical protein
VTTTGFESDPRVPPRSAPTPLGRRPEFDGRRRTNHGSTWPDPYDGRVLPWSRKFRSVSRWSNHYWVAFSVARMPFWLTQRTIPVRNERSGRGPCVVQNDSATADGYVLPRTSATWAKRETLPRTMSA